MALHQTVLFQNFIPLTKLLGSIQLNHSLLFFIAKELFYKIIQWKLIRGMNILLHLLSLTYFFLNAILVIGLPKRSFLTYVTLHKYSSCLLVLKCYFSYCICNIFRNSQITILQDRSSDGRLRYCRSSGAFQFFNSVLAQMQL